MFFTLAFRTVVMFVVILVTMRILGKRQMGQLELSELVVAIMISELAVSPITNPDHRLWHGIVPVLVLLVCELLIAYVCMKNNGIRKFIIGKPSIIIQDGTLNQKEMRKNRLTLTELAENLRSQGHTDISSIKYAILEVGGSISVLPFNEYSPATYGAHGLTAEDKGLPRQVIADGKIYDENLTSLGLDRKWLEKRLHERDTKNPEDVFLFTVDEMGNIYFVKRYI